MGCDLPIENNFIYFPTRDMAYTPSDAGLQYEEIDLQTDDGVRIKAWYIPADGAGTTMLWFHGNAGNIGDRVGQLKVYRDRWSVHQLIVEYRGYGQSQGRLSEEGTYADGRAALHYLVDEKGVPPDSLILFGRSLGAAVAVQMAAEFSCAGLILESPFASIREMAGVHYPLLSRIVPLKTHYDSTAKMDKIKSPLLILHGDRDAIVPQEQGKKLFDLAKGPKQFYTIRNAGHNDILERVNEEYHQTVRAFIRDCMREES
jgi:pimeloyl-ACP methyl ester carboxylesterase